MLDKELYGIDCDALGLTEESNETMMVNDTLPMPENITILTDLNHTVCKAEIETQKQVTYINAIRGPMCKQEHLLYSYVVDFIEVTYFVLGSGGLRELLLREVSAETGTQINRQRSTPTSDRLPQSKPRFEIFAPFDPQVQHYVQEILEIQLLY